MKQGWRQKHNDDRKSKKSKHVTDLGVRLILSFSQNITTQTSQTCFMAGRVAVSSVKIFNEVWDFLQYWSSCNMGFLAIWNKPLKIHGYQKQCPLELLHSLQDAETERIFRTVQLSDHKKIHQITENNLERPFWKVTLDRSLSC